MKSIELTEKHKSKILEMCEELFPEYIKIYLGVNDYDPEPDGYIYFTKNKNITRIHWFEFCTITLWNELYLKLGTLELKSYYELLLNDLIHPVDYLYKQFETTK